MRGSGAYDDIINLPHHVSTTRIHMKREDRAAQFSPFAALTGHGAAIRETARLTDRKLDLDENEKASLDEKLSILEDRIEDHPTVTVTYFVPDERKAGGRYATVTGQLKRIEPVERELLLDDGCRIGMDEVVWIEE
jgi:hypothetical protein